MNILVTDRISPERHAVVDAVDVASIVGHWLHADGALGVPSPTVRALVVALRRGQWARVHALAEHLSLSVEVAS